MLLLPFLFACASPEAPVEADVRVDHTPPGSTVASTSPSSCLSRNGRTYVAWADDREATPGIWANASIDAAQTWQMADARLDHGSVGAWNPSVACQGERAWVAWEDARDGELENRNIYLSRTTDGGRHWSEAEVMLDDDAEGRAMSLGPRVVAAGDRVAVAWFDNRDGAYDIYVRSSTDEGRTWNDAPVRVDTDDAGAAWSAWPQLALDEDGTLVVTWEDSRDGVSDVRVNASTDGGLSFGRDVQLDTGEQPANSFLPQIAMAGEHVYVTWHDERSGAGRDVLLSSSSDGGYSWIPSPLRLDADAPGMSDSLNPALAAEGDRVHVAWQDARSGGYDILLRSSSDGGATWNDEVRMDGDQPGVAQSYAPVVRVLGTDVVVAWIDRRNDTDAVGFDDLYYAYSEDSGGAWNSGALRVNANEPGSAWTRDLDLHLRDDGLVAVWADGRTGSSDIFAAHRALGEEGIWVPPPPEDGE